MRKMLEKAIFLVMIKIGIKTEWTKGSRVLIERSDKVMSVSESMASVMKAMSSINWYVSGVRGSMSGMVSISVVISCKKIGKTFRKRKTP